MPQIPTTQIQFFYVPWTPDYTHVRWFSDEDQRDRWFDERWREMSESEKTYFPNETIIYAQPYKVGEWYTINGRYEGKYRINYMRYQNDTGGWQYCFVTDWRYQSEHSVSFLAVHDVFVNNVGHIDFKPCFIERQHTAGDATTTVPEPISISHYRSRNLGTFAESGNDLEFFVVLKADYVYSPEESAKANSYTTIDGRGYPYCMRGYSSYDDALASVNSFVAAGYADNIVTVLCIPKNYVSYTNGVPAMGDNPATATTMNFAMEQTHTINRTRIGDYTPKNKKCLQYPYFYFEVGDHTGNTQVFKWESTGLDNAARFITRGTVTPGGVIELRPDFTKDNCGYTNNLIHNIVFEIGYSSGFGGEGTYNQNAAQFKVQNYSNRINTLLGTFDVASNAMNNMISAGSQIAGGISQDANGSPQVNMPSIGQLWNTVNPLGTQSGYYHVLANNKISGMNLEASISQLQFASNPSVPPDNSLAYFVRKNLAGFWAYEYEPYDSELRALDDFFTVYGYAYHQIGTPNPERRSAYYYCKTQNAKVSGHMPIADRMAIEQALNTGVTFWRSNDFGNYNQTNT